VILTVETTEITACAGKRKALGAWMEMVERFFLDGVDGQRTRLGIYLAKEYATSITTTATTTCLAIGNMAVVRTELALYYPTLKPLIIPTLFHTPLFF
jgi:hypothetical protein